MAKEGRMTVREAVHAMAADRDWWDLLDGELLDDVDCGRPVSPTEVGETPGMSAGAAAALLTMLVRDGRVRLASAVASPRMP
jgi:hypothetical protein